MRKVKELFDMPSFYADLESDVSMQSELDEGINFGG
jgi:hypothetical protein